MLLKRPVEIVNCGDEEIVLEPGGSVDVRFKMNDRKAEIELIKER